MQDWKIRAIYEMVLAPTLLTFLTYQQKSTLICLFVTPSTTKLKVDQIHPNRYCNKYSLIMLSIIGMALIALITYAALINPMDVSTGKVFSLLTLILKLFLHYYHIIYIFSYPLKRSRILMVR